MSEKEVAKQIGAKLVRNSGRGIRKADMLKGKHVIDLKETGKSFTLNQQVWQKICDDAMSYDWDCIPVLLIKFNDTKVKLVVVGYDDYDWGEDG